MKETVVLGFLGPSLDRAKMETRWQKWRPSVAACYQDDVHVDRFELIFQERFTPLLEVVTDDIKEISPSTKIIPHQIEFKDPWDFEEMFSKLHDFASGYPFDPEKEDYLINITTGTHVAQICLFLLAESRYIPGKLYQLGTDPSNPAKGTARIIDLDLANYDPIVARFEKAKQESQNFLKAGIPTRNKKFNELIERIENVANRSTDPILIMGESGVGKTELTRRIYQFKKQRRQFQGPFVEVNCATLKGDAVMSTLFGHVKGAFTGALKERKGLLKEADGGLLFLDEIGELGLDEQAMLLRALEDKRFLPMGSDKEISSDFQLIAGTNRDLKSQVQKGEFREDLFNRMNIWTFQLPRLAERREDIEPNIEYELEKYSKRTKKKLRFTEEGLSSFLKFAKAPSSKWRGNFRDLNAAMTRMATLANSGRITKDDVVMEIQNLKSSWHEDETATYFHCERLLSGKQMDELDLFDLSQLETVLKICGESKTLSEAGRKLFAASRIQRKSVNDTDRLKKYLAKFSISPASALS